MCSVVIYKAEAGRLVRVTQEPQRLELSAYNSKMSYVYYVQ